MSVCRIIVLLMIQQCVLAFSGARNIKLWHANGAVRPAIQSSTTPGKDASLHVFRVAVLIPTLAGQVSGKLAGLAVAVQNKSIALPAIWKAMSFFAVAFIGSMSRKFNVHVQGAVNAMEKAWVKRGTGSAFSRTVDIYVFSISFAFRYFKVERLKSKDPNLYIEGKQALAIILRDKLLELGPTFIKLGQLLSTRIDVFPKEYITELALLQDQVPGFDGNKSVEIIEKELGMPITEAYDTFNRTAIAAASLGQVHIATKDGKKLAVKVQRQGLKRLFDMDLKNIRVLAILLNKYDSKSEGAQPDWVSIYNESAKLLYKEIDYRAEALNAIRFRENFAGTSWVKVPEVYLNMTTSCVITMEYVPGIKISDIEKIEKAGIDRQLLAKRSAEAYLTQLCRHGFFHCDPHPGNVACDTEQGGRLIFYDFGMMDELKPETKAGLVNLIFGIYENNVKEVLSALEQIEVLRPGADKFAVENLARFFLKEFSSGMSKGGQWANQLPLEEQRCMLTERRKQLGADLFSIGSDGPFKFPPTFTFVFRAFTSLDGIGKGLDSSYDLTVLAQPFLKELVDLHDGSAFLSLLKSWGKAVGWRPIDLAHTIQQPRKVAYLEDTLLRMEQGDLKLRVRVLESERAFKRLTLVQSNMALAIAASSFLNMAILLSTITTPTGVAVNAAKATFVLAGFFGIQVPFGLLRLRSLDRRYSDINGGD